MKKIEELIIGIVIGIVIAFLTIHLFITHSKLLFHLNPDKTIEQLNYSFSLDLFSSDMLVSTLSALAYSLITALILAIFVKYKKVFLISVISFAILDGIGVFVYYNIGITKNLFVIIGSVYYALYTIFIIVSLGMYRNIGYSDIHLNKEIDNSIQEVELKDKLGDFMTDEFNHNIVLANYFDDGLSQQKIAKKYNISQSKVSRIIKKYKNHE